ncbi:apolipoprotein E [Pseudonaja textilis]|uniref:apolipoprotein E n=1 Tax=Pseudonaja textilis TaxID=8673 RepID=UPI000EAA626F|nr:apolipoprotein E [Pseudonaja textilis]
MKLFALLFAVGLLSASWANPFFQDEPKSKWEETMDVFWGYVTKAASVADDITAQIRGSQLNKELDGLITDTIGEVEIYTEDLRSKFGPYTQELQERLVTEVSALTGKLRNDMEETKAKLLQYSRDTQLVIDHNVDNVKSQFNLLLRKMKKRLTKDAEELRQKLRAYTEEMRTNAEEKVSSVRQNLEPYFSNVREKGQQRIQALQQAIGEQGRMVQEQLNSRVQELKKQFQERLQEVKNAFDQAVDKLRQLVNPILEDIGVQAETGVEEINQEA